MHIRESCLTVVDGGLWRNPPPPAAAAACVRAPQDTTFNQNLSYTILSWPEEHVQDLLELWRLQALFFATIVFNILLSGLLFFAENPDRCARVLRKAEGPEVGMVFSSLAKSACVYTKRGRKLMA